MRNNNFDACNCNQRVEDPWDSVSIFLKLLIKNKRFSMRIDVIVTAVSDRVDKLINTVDILSPFIYNSTVFMVISTSLHNILTLLL